jgi:hypothetical protein
MTAETRPTLIQPRQQDADENYWPSVAKNMRLTALQLDEKQRVNYVHQGLTAAQLRTLARLLEEHHGPTYLVNMPAPPMPLWKQLTWAAWGAILLDSVLKDIWWLIWWLL